MGCKQNAETISTIAGAFPRQRRTEGGAILGECEPEMCWGNANGDREGVRAARGHYFNAQHAQFMPKPYNPLLLNFAMAALVRSLHGRENTVSIFCLPLFFSLDNKHPFLSGYSSVSFVCFLVLVNSRSPSLQKRVFSCTRSAPFTHTSY